MIDCFTDWFIDWLIDWIIDWYYRFIDWLIYWFINWLVDWFINLLIDWLIDWLIDLSIYWLILYFYLSLLFIDITQAVSYDGHQIVLYWGQNSARKLEKPLKHFCTTGHYDVIVLNFVTHFFTAASKYRHECYRKSISNYLRL